MALRGITVDGLSGSASDDQVWDLLGSLTGLGRDDALFAARSGAARSRGYARAAASHAAGGGAAAWTAMGPRTSVQDALDWAARYERAAAVLKRAVKAGRRSVLRSDLAAV